MKKILTLEDLVVFCEQNKMMSFNAKESGTPLCVAVAATYEKDDDNSNSSMLFGKIKLLHTGRNRNGSNVTEKAAKKCMDSLAYKPILANFCEIDGERDFTSHDMCYSADGEVTYLERQVGSFTADKPSMEYDEEKDRYYVYANVAIPREYTDAADIIERKGGTKVSAELLINSMSYDAEKKELVLEDIEVMGATCLGKNPETGADVQEGMEGARLDIADFEAKTVIFDKDERLIKVLEELNTTLSSFNIGSEGSAETSRKGGAGEMMDNEEIIETESNVEETPEVEVVEEAAQEPEVETEAEAEDEQTEGEAAEETESAEEVEESAEVPVVEANSVKYSVSVGETVKEFSVSLSEVIFALESLVNDTYSEADNAYYSVDVYADDKMVVMHDWWAGKNYRQSYKVRNDTYSLVGDRVEVFAQYLTNDEIKKLDDMRANYAVIEDKLAKYEAEPEKMEILNKECYASVADTDEFKDLVNNHFDTSVEEVANKADAILLNAAKNGALNFAVAEPEKVKPVKVMGMPVMKKKVSRYGNLFSKKD